MKFMNLQDHSARDQFKTVHDQFMMNFQGEISRNLQQLPRQTFCMAENASMKKREKKEQQSRRDMCAQVHAEFMIRSWWVHGRFMNKSWPVRDQFMIIPWPIHGQILQVKLLENCSGGCPHKPSVWPKKLRCKIRWEEKQKSRRGICAKVHDEFMVHW